MIGAEAEAPEQPSLNNRSPIAQRAVVLGGSMAGLLAARVLSNFFEQVTIFDRDTFPEDPENRRGVPQGHHFHALLARGQRILDQLYPGFTDEMLRRTAVLQCGTQAKQLRRYGLEPAFASSLMCLFSSRHLLEWTVRQRTTAIPGIELIPSTGVTGLSSKSSSRYVDGVRVVDTDDDTGDLQRVVPADLIVDATGRASAAPKWLTQSGWDSPPETVVNAHWGYASRVYQAVEGLLPTFAVGHYPLGSAGSGPTRTRGGYVMPQDGGRWIITLLGCSGDYPPTNESEFLAFARTLALPEIATAIEEAEPLSPIHQSRATQNRFRHYERVTRRPEAFLCVGDSVSAFNPVFGQGMTVAAMTALDLQSELEFQAATSGDDFAGLAERFQARVALTSEFPWAVSSGSDYGVEGVEGDPQPVEQAAMKPFMDRLEALCADDPGLVLKLNETMQMSRDASWIFDDADLRIKVEENWVALGERVKAPDLGYR
jgi:2-polyprenyl-6-methoxyphenol hydroxylase-like FAD-dependent oxidoreductase